VRTRLVFQGRGFPFCTPPFSGNLPERNRVQVCPKRGARFVAVDAAENGEESLLRQFFSARGVLEPAAEKSVDRIAVPRE